MRCEDFGKLLDPYLDEELAEEMRALVDRHLLNCPKCAFEVNALRHSVRTLQAAIDRVEPSDAFIRRVSDRLRGRLTPHLRSTPQSTPGGQWTLPFAREELSGTDS